MRDNTGGNNGGARNERGNSGRKIAVVAILAVAMVGVVWAESAKKTDAQTQPTPLPRLVDLGSVTCIPCKMMAPILDELKKDYAGKLEVEFIDVARKPEEGKKYGIKLIPTQIFFDASGKELFRHEGFFAKDDILARWKQLGVDLGSSSATAPGGVESVVREEPLVRDNRPADQVCSMCERTVDPKTRVVADAPWGKANLCSVHCFAIYYSSLRDTKGIAGKVAVTDWSSGKGVPLEKAIYLYSFEKNGRPAIKAFEDKAAATAEAAKTPGEVMEWRAVLNKELTTPCGFCGRAVYEADAANVAILAMRSGCCGGPRPVAVEVMYACCPMCALGVCAKLQKDVEVTQKDGLTDEKVYVRILNVTIEWVQPSTAVAWFGQKKNKDGKMSSAGCFHQFFFASEENLRKWLEKHPEESGSMITIAQALADKMKLTPEQIGNACKIGECVPK